MQQPRAARKKGCRGSESAKADTDTCPAGPPHGVPPGPHTGTHPDPYSGITGQGRVTVSTRVHFETLHHPLQPMQGYGRSEPARQRRQSPRVVATRQTSFIAVVLGCLGSTNLPWHSAWGSAPTHQSKGADHTNGATSAPGVLSQGSRALALTSGRCFPPQRGDAHLHGESPKTPLQPVQVARAACSRIQSSTRIQSACNEIIAGAPKTFRQQGHHSHAVPT